MKAIAVLLFFLVALGVVGRMDYDDAVKAHHAGVKK